MADLKDYSPREVQLLLTLIQEASTLEKTKHFLAAKGVPYSANAWTSLIQDRFQPALKSGSVTPLQCVHFLREEEEHGSQHIFLYRTSPTSIQRFIDRARVEATLRERGLQSILQHPRILDKPRTSEIVEVRWEEGKFIVKIVETRTYWKTVEATQNGNRRTTIEEVNQFRAVNLFRLHKDGLLELRLQSHRNSSRYAADIERTWATVGTLLPSNQFEKMSLVTAKTLFMKNRVQLGKDIRYSNSHLRNSSGFILSGATPDIDTTLDDDQLLSQGLDNFLAKNAYCEQLNAQFGYPSEEGEPRTWIHVRMAGIENEFALPTSCSRQHYEYVLERIREYNQSDSN